MEIRKRSIITRSNVQVSTVIIHFESFKPVPHMEKLTISQKRENGGILLGECLTVKN